MEPGFPPGVIAAARDAAKDYARVARDDEDAVIDTLAASALAMAEHFTGQAIIIREHQAVLTACARWQVLPGAPVMAITAVEGLPAEGAAFDLPVDAYAIDIDEHGEGWVRTMAPGSAGRIRVTYQAGMATDWGSLPAPLAQGVTRLITHLLAARDSDDAPPPAAVTALWRPYCRMRLTSRVRA